MTAVKTITAQELDEKFDNGEDVSAYFDLSKARRPNLEARRVNVDFPEWIIDKLDLQSKLIGVSRQSLIKLWVSERIQQEHQNQKSLTSAST